MGAKHCLAGVPVVAIVLVACTAGRSREAVRGSPPTVSRAVYASVGQRCQLTPSSLPKIASSGGSIVLSPSQQLAAAVDTDNDRVVLLEITRGAVTAERAIAVGHRPAQAALGSDGRLYVTERGDQTASVYDLASGRRLCRTEAGLDPVGIALSPDQATLIVTSGVDHKLTAIDTETFAARYVVSVPREPRGVAVTPDGARAVLAHVAGEPLSVVDLRPDVTRRAIAVPHPPISGDEAEPDLRPPFAPRAAGLELAPLDEATLQFAAQEGIAESDIGRRAVVRPFASQGWSVAIDASGERVAIPFMVSRTGNNTLFSPDAEVATSDEYGGGTTGGTGERVSFALGVFNARTLQWERVARPFREFSAEEGFDPQAPSAVRAPSGVAFGPDGAVYVTSMGTSAVARLATTSADFFRTSATVQAPCGIAALRDGTLLVFSQFDHAVQLDRRHRTAPPSTEGAPALASSLAGQAAAREEVAVETVSLGEDPLDAEIALGRRLFHRADDLHIAAGGFSCAGCHPDGRDDGLVWFLPAGARQTPTLAGRLERPFNWNGTHESLEANIAQTIQRLGGSGLASYEVSALAAYLSRGLTAPGRAPRELTTAEARGRELFEGEAECAGCHSPERNFTDGARHRFPGSAFPETQPSFDTPSLAFVEGTAPYFHDGRYDTLRAVLGSRRHHMGSASRLAAGDLDALEAYLRTL